jgi:hypothetical protein
MSGTAKRARASRERRMRHNGTLGTLTHLPSETVERVRVSPIRSMDRAQDGTRVVTGRERFELLPAVRGAQFVEDVKVGDYLLVGTDGYRVADGGKPERVGGVVVGWRVEATEG